MGLVQARQDHDIIIMSRMKYLFIRNRLIYKEQWDAAIGKELKCQHKRGNAAMLKIFCVFSFLS